MKEIMFVNVEIMKCSRSGYLQVMLFSFKEKLPLKYNNCTFLVIVSPVF